MPYATNLFFQEMNTFMNMGSRILTTHEPTKLKGMDQVEQLVKVDITGVPQPLQPIEFPEINLPLLPTRAPAPTTTEVAEELAKLNGEAVEAYKAPPPVNLNTLSQLQSKATTAQEEIQLDPGSFAPIQPQVQALQQPQQTIEPAAVTTTGIPIINIDTSPSAMAEAGLREPKESTGALTQLQQQQAPLQGQSSTRRRLVRRIPQQPQQQQQQQQQQPEEDQGPQQYAQKVTVNKLG